MIAFYDTMLTRQLLGKVIDQEDKNNFSNRTPPSLALSKSALQNGVLLQVDVFYHENPSWNNTQR